MTPSHLSPALPVSDAGPLTDLAALAGHLPTAWRSRILGEVGPARIKVLRMDGEGAPQETHDYNEALLVVDGCLQLGVGAQAVEVHAGQLYLAQAGVPHTVLPGSHGTLVIVDM